MNYRAFEFKVDGDKLLALLAGDLKGELYLPDAGTSQIKQFCQQMFTEHRQELAEDISVCWAMNDPSIQDIG